MLRHNPIFAVGSARNGEMDAGTLITNILTILQLVFLSDEKAALSTDS